jgi:peptidoglycan L-alanyl-D-glutamate endopeptidase CwlK
LGGFFLSNKSLAQLNAVHVDLATVVKRAIEETRLDFTVIDGLRTEQEQKVNVANGVSKTMKSRHLTGHAVDLVPYVDGRLRWEWTAICTIAEAVRKAALAQAIPIRWGGAWNQMLTDSEADPGDMMANYVLARQTAGRKAFLDGPHYELPENVYP